MLLHLLTYIAPQIGGGLAGTAVTKAAVENPNLRLQTPGLPDKGWITDVRAVVGAPMVAIGVGLVSAKNPVLQGLGFLFLGVGSSMLGSLSATEIVRAKALALKGGGAAPAGAPARLTAGADLDPAYQFAGADGCSDQYVGEDGHVYSDLPYALAG